MEPSCVKDEGNYLCRVKYMSIWVRWRKKKLGWTLLQKDKMLTSSWPMKWLIWDNNVWRYCKYYIVMSPIFNSFFNMIKSNISWSNGSWIYNSVQSVPITTNIVSSKQGPIFRMTDRPKVHLSYNYKCMRFNLNIQCRSQCKNGWFLLQNSRIFVSMHAHSGSTIRY